MRGSILSAVVQIALAVSGVGAQCMLEYNGIDVSSSISPSQWTCLNNSGYAYAEIRVYQGFGNGSIDPNALQNAMDAQEAGIGPAPYHYPSPMKDGGVQFMEVYNWFIDNGANLGDYGIWLDVEIGLWGPNQTYNQGVIQDYVDAAVRMNVTVGIYSRSTDWTAVVGNWMGPTAVDFIWYANNGPQNFDDFVPFGRWTKANVLMKQFAQNQVVCGANVNLDYYCFSATNKSMKKPITMRTHVKPFVMRKKL